MRYPMSTSLEQHLVDNIHNTSFPCLGAKAAARKNQVHIERYKDLRSSEEIARLGADLLNFVNRHAEPRSDFAVQVAVDTVAISLDELDFETYLWSVLQHLHSIDDARWDPRYSDDPESSSFKFSFAGRAFYIIGLSPTASRISRRFPHPTIVFNPVWQFERLRELGQLDGLIEKIRQRDIALQGSINPNLRLEGWKSDALQYSGRSVTA